MVSAGMTKLAPVAIIAIALSGCSRSLHEASFTTATPVANWSGVNNLSHDSGVYFGGQPTADALGTARKMGVRVVVNLRSDQEMAGLDFDEAALVERRGMKYVGIPVTPQSFGPADADALKEVLRKTPGPVLIHCGSSNRVGALWAMYLHRHRGVALDDAIALGRKAGLRSEGLVETIRKSADLGYRPPTEVSATADNNHEDKRSAINAFPSPGEVEAAMNQAMEGSDLPAVVAVAIHRNGQRISYASGKAIWGGEVEVSADHLFRIYSMTKMVTSIAAMQLVERGLVALDDDLSSLLPEMAKIPILQNGKLSAPKQAITLRHLLTHTSGFGYPLTDAELSTFSTEDWTYEDYPRRFESGTRFLYGTSTDWVGKLVEKRSGVSLEVYFKQHIFEPLGMSRTFYNVPDSLKPLIVSMGSRGEDGEGKLEESPKRVPEEETTKFSGGSGLFSSPSDYTTLLECMLHLGAGPGGPILKKETVLEMTKNQVGSISLDPTGRYFDPGACCNFTGLMDADSKWGLAFMIDNNDRPYGRKSGTVLWGGLRNTYFYIDYKSGVAACIFSQQLPFNHTSTTSLFEAFSELAYRNIK